MDSERADTGAGDEPNIDPDTSGRPPSFGRVSLTLLANQTHVNLLGNVHGGEVMRLVDSTAGAAAGRHSGGPAVTAAMDEMAFLAPVKVGDILRATAQVNWAGRTSMEVGVRVDSEPWNQAGTEPVHVASAYLVFVAIDAEGNLVNPEPGARQRQGGTPHARGRDPALAPACTQGGDRRGPLPLSGGRIVGAPSPAQRVWLVILAGPPSPLDDERSSPRWRLPSSLLHRASARAAGSPTDPSSAGPSC